MNFIKPKDFFKAYSTWALGTITASTALSPSFEALANFIPAPYQPYVISIMGLIGLIGRAIKQRG